MQANALETYVHTMSAAAAELAEALEDGASRRKVEFWPPLGTVQRRIVALDQLASAEGMAATEIARLANRPGGPSTEIVLDTLARRGVVERVAGERYRLAAQYRQVVTPLRRETATMGPRRIASHG